MFSLSGCYSEEEIRAHQLIATDMEENSQACSFDKCMESFTTVYSEAYDKEIDGREMKRERER